MAEATFELRPIRPEDYSQVSEIYEMGLESGHATYENAAPSWEQFKTKKIMETVFVAVEQDDPTKILGWVSAAPASSRAVFYGVVEDSIYVHPDGRGRGVSGALLDKLIETCTELGKWVIHSWIFPENSGSVKLHESRGFVKVGEFRDIAKMTYGEMAGQWRSTAVYEKLLPKPEERDAR